MSRIIECVPNFSEGRDMAVIEQITAVIKSVEGVKLLDVDPGKATNRTVVTFTGDPENVVEAAFMAVRAATGLIDMTRHHGEHPRFGATDVCPLIPVSGVSMEETVEYARQLGKRIGEELNIPVYCYENAAFTAERRNLASVRSGQYEGLKEKLSDPAWKPDFGKASFNPQAGAIAVGARDFLVAYNINLNTTSTRRANAIAFDVREKGRVKRKGDPLTGEIVKDENGKPVYTPGTLKSVKAIGWYIEEYGIAQISMNLTNISVTSIHEAFDEVSRKALDRGIRVSGSELVGLVPLKAMLDAGKYFLRKQKRSTGISDEEIIKIAVKSLGLDDLYPFMAEDKIIEYRMQKGNRERKLVDFSLEAFMHETASESAAPGGGSVSAALGALGTALGTMVANLSAHKRGWDDRWEEFSNQADKGKSIQEELLKLIDEDTRAFNRIMDAFKLPKKSEEDKKSRKAAIHEATMHAISIPFKVMKTAYMAYDLLEAMAENGNPNSVSDAGVGALAVRSAIRGAWLNVRINTKGFDDENFLDDILTEGAEIVNKSDQREAHILKIVENKLGD
ncbi:MAG TPA: glutamate formimidoyltransferase [Bacteroidales bacterium]|nr:glutamate formimidoyltransferase [Bacteroidales bacterium]